MDAFFFTQIIRIIFHAECAEYAETYQTQTMRRFAIHIIHRILRAIIITLFALNPQKSQYLLDAKFASHRDSYNSANSACQL